MPRLKLKNKKKISIPYVPICIVEIIKGLMALRMQLINTSVSRVSN